MTIELMSLVTILSVGFAIFSGVVNLRRNKTSDDKNAASVETTLLIKLESIQKDTSEIKNDLKSVKEDTKKNTEAIIRNEESLKSAWRAINKLQDGTADDGK